MQSPKGPKATKAKKVKETRASPDAMDEDQPSDEEPKEDELAMRPKGQKAKKAKSKGKETWTSPDAMDEDSPSDDDREELQALVPTVDKGKNFLCRPWLQPHPWFQRHHRGKSTSSRRAPPPSSSRWPSS
ncbi:hypothetical protein PAXINDRAFT_20439 [Paxillus involutus ATCC 200175]|uniref:Unplaced genomic scaffold PAXINscaffold_1039, whole genome shotgun sequence n=1 Tax=Paxillus involutus ATCC 200175 TaxID=664439 RepID=A0A0C9TGE6_PAXIN|nr:hypothetical protein PAXINDRAFT_20439 [Paxillus involutus ATCC 200175]